MATVYSVIMNKGGTGKTTLATNLAAVIRETEPDATVLIIDMDGQGNSSLAYGRVPGAFSNTMYDVMVGQASIRDILEPLGKRLYIAPSNSDMNFIELDILTNPTTFPNPLDILREKVEAVSDIFDYIIIDSPPSMGVIASNILAIKDSRVLIPFCPEMYSVQGLLNVVKEVRNFKEKKNPSLEIAGVIGQMINSNTVLHSNLMQDARRNCDKMGVPFLDTVVPRTIRVAEATADSKKPIAIVGRHKVSQNYYDIWKELSAVGTK